MVAAFAASGSLGSCRAGVLAQTRLPLNQMKSDQAGCGKESTEHSSMDHPARHAGERNVRSHWEATLRESGIRYRYPQPLDSGDKIDAILGNA
jgi:hypothetical protein